MNGEFKGNARKLRLQGVDQSALTAGEIVGGKGITGLDVMEIARLKPMARRYRKLSSQRIEHRKAIGDAKRGMARKQPLTSFTTSSSNWQVTVSNVETFMFPSLTLEHGVEKPKASLQWNRKRIYANEQSDFTEPEHLRLSESEAKRQTFDRKLEYAERLLRLQSLQSYEEEQQLLQHDQSSSSPSSHPTSHLLNTTGQDISDHRHDNGLTVAEFTPPSKDTYYKSKTNCFNKWSKLNSATLQEESTAKSSTNSPRSSYYDTCVQDSIVPEPLLRRITLDGELQLAHFGIGNSRLIALSPALQYHPTLTSINLSNNRLTSKSVKILLNVLRQRSDDKQSMTYIRNLNFSQNDLSTTTALTTYLTSNAGKVLNSLDISSTRISDEDLLPLTPVLELHPKLLTLNLSRNNIGCSGGKLIGQILSSSSVALVNVDLSWNRIADEGAVAIGQSIRDNTSLRSLNLSMNRLGDVTGGVQLASSLLENTFLTALDLSNNNIGDVTAITISHSLRCENNNSLKSLSLKCNPIGRLGIRALFSSLNLVSLSLPTPSTSISSSTLFDVSLPTAHSPYDLSLTSELAPYHFVIASEILRVATTGTKICSVTGVKYTTTQSDTSNNTNSSISQARVSKLVNNLVSSTNTPDDNNSGASLSPPPPGTLRLVVEYTPNCPSLANVIPNDESIDWLVSQVLACGADNPRDISTFLSLAFSDIYISTSQAQTLISKLEGKVDVIDLLSNIILRIVDGENTFKLLRTYVKDSKDQSRFLKKCGLAVLSFNACNPVGSWNLDLGDARHRLIAQWFANINGSHSLIRRKKLSGDTSQHGNFSNFRNEKFNGKAIVLDNSFFECLPSRGALEFNYVCNYGNHHSTTINNTIANVDEVLSQVGGNNSKSSSDQQNFYELATLHVALAGKTITTQKVLKLLSHYSKCDRVKVIFATFAGLVDLENFKVCMDKLSASNKKLVLKSLGCLNILNPFQPQWEYDCNLENHDERVITRVLVDLALADPRDSVRMSTTQSSDVHVYELYAIATMPTKGMIRFRYTSFADEKLVVTKLRYAALKYFLLEYNSKDNNDMI